MFKTVFIVTVNLEKSFEVQILVIFFFFFFFNFRIMNFF